MDYALWIGGSQLLAHWPIEFLQSIVQPSDGRLLWTFFLARIPIFLSLNSNRVRMVLDDSGRDLYSLITY